MKCWDEKDEYGECKGEKDMRDAQDLCKLLEIPFKQVFISYPPSSSPFS
jgi:tRNA U34 2-thiouridine synthase MnmA/TrmU